MNNYIINGGSHSIPHDVENLIAHGGVYYIRGNIGNLTMHGGIIYDQRPSNRVEYCKDKMSDDERRRYNQSIDTLERKLSSSHHEVMMLRAKLRDLQNQEDKRPSSDDVLIQKIRHLESELEKEKAAHTKEVEELKANIDGILEVNNNLRDDINDRDKRSQDIADRHIDILATCLALYPFTPDKDLEFEFGIPRDKISMVARILGVAKSPEERKKAVEYLAKQNRELIQRRGGAQVNHFTKPVEQVAKNGRVINTFISSYEAKEITGYAPETIRKYCGLYNNKKLRTYTKEGFTFRHKKQ